jgi:UDP-N-acetylmuramyl pentapeptide phosphotransferase/UDP-N-acetylglucosamine-1-phosphate transferase
VTSAAAALGAYDDLAGHTHARGLRGHAAALRAGVVTSGLVKMAGLTVVAALSAPTRPRRLANVAVDTVLVAGSANLVNLLDLRPGRALKVVAAVSVPLALGRETSSEMAAGAVGVTLACLPGDLDERQMLGDCGANALGAAVGWSLAMRLRGAARLAAAGVVVGLTVASERVSFSRLIDRAPALAAIDRWGRQLT